MEKWFVCAKKDDFAGISARFGIDPVTARVIRNRDVTGDEAIRRYLHPDLADLHSPLAMGGVLEAAQLLAEKIRSGANIRIIGDYDIDGVCASAILQKAITMLGGRADVRIPERMRDGYGLNMRLIEEAFSDDADTILTCDNGISAVEQIRYARSLGMTVIVTDHHEPLFEMEGDEKKYLLPPANVLVDPHLPGDPCPYPDICGAVVAWKVMMPLALLMRGGDPRSFTGNWAALFPEEFLCLAAFATVGDVMDLRDENRIIVRCGLEAMQRNENAGLRALVDGCGLSGRKLGAYHIGFVLGPCINATGRLETARAALELLTTKDEAKAAGLVEHLISLNNERKELTEKSTARALELAAALPPSLSKVQVIYLEECHESIAGIVAGRVRERTAHPVFILTDSQETGLLKGSGRSVPSYPMFDALVSCAGLLEKFGGHAMAAGLSLKKENLEAFARALNDQCTLSDEDFYVKVMIDVPMPVSYLTRERIEELSLLEPFGKGNEKPLFAQKNLEVLGARKIGKTRTMLKLLLRDPDSHTQIDGLFFGDSEEMLSYLRTRFGEGAVQTMLQGRPSGITLSAVYEPGVNTYRGETSLQIIIEHYR